MPETSRTGRNTKPSGAPPPPPTPPPSLAPQRTIEVGTAPRDLSLALLRRDERVNGWYESRPANSILHERVRATLIGFRTYVLDGKIATDAMVLPQERNTSIGFVPMATFVVSDAATIERGGPSMPENLTDPY